MPDTTWMKAVEQWRSLTREALGILPGQRMQVVPCGDRIELVPMRGIGEMRGFLAGMDSRFEREPDREL